MNLNNQLFFGLNNLSVHSQGFSKLVVFCAQDFAYVVAFLAVVFLVYFFITDKDWRGKKLIAWGIESATIVGTVFLAWLVSFIIKTIAHAPRPFVVFPQVHPLLIETKYDSFPSGHATVLFALAMAIYLYNKRAGIFFFVCGIVVTLARVSAGIHFPVDIVAGAVIGIGVAWVAHGYIQKTLSSIFSPRNQ